MKTLDFVRENAENRLLLQQQLEKDYARMGEVFPNNFGIETLSWEQIIDSVRELTVNILEAGEPKLLQLLYLIDVPEKIFIALLSKENFLEELIMQIIQREAEKIYFRQQYRS